ncbi:ABC transporter ATP-binding protein [Baekduia sp. Peel2402]|uniref:ABC transporter ATP-binding protein n=1 Tax=Baekduia sp. Peel2402 TaxID=3458296 RepID=UPI00403ED8AD
MTGAILDVTQAEREQRIAAARTAVSIEHLAKTFRLPHQRYSTLKERALHPFRSTTFDELRALRDVHVEIREGEFFGIVGRNGSGKSTLLKCLAGIYRPDAGRVTLHGRLSPFIELGVGFNPDLTARDNIVINAVMMGLSRREARERFEHIIAFAELEEFVDLKLKNYSSGMAVRLGFATAIQVDADILLVDEVLAVGDAAFQQKCFEEFARLREEGKTIVFVTHDMHAVERFCDRAMLIERGAVLEIGEPREIARAYNELNFGRLVHEASGEDDEHHRLGDQGLAEIVEAWFEHDGERVKQIAQGQQLTIAVTVRFHAEVAHPIIGVTLRNEMGHTFFVSTTEWQGLDLGTRQAGDRMTLRFTLDTPFAQSRYLLTPSIARAGSGADAIDIREDLTSVHIHATQHTGGLVDMPHTIEVEEA